MSAPLIVLGAILIVCLLVLYNKHREDFASVSVLRDMYLSDEPNYSTCKYLPLPEVPTYWPPKVRNWHHGTFYHPQTKFVYSDNPIRNYY